MSKEGQAQSAHCNGRGERKASRFRRLTLATRKRYFWGGAAGAGGFVEALDDRVGDLDGRRRRPGLTELVEDERQAHLFADCIDDRLDLDLQRLQLTVAGPPISRSVLRALHGDLLAASCLLSRQACPRRSEIALVLRSRLELRLFVHRLACSGGLPASS
jgi:hypothetical protein